MISKASLFALLVLSSVLFAADEPEYSVVWGKALENKFPGAFPVCPEDHVCMNAWFRFTIDVERVIDGVPVEGKVKAARVQHAEHVISEDDRAVFVLRNIKSEETKEILDADYFLEEWSRPQVWHCFLQPAEKYDSTLLNEIELDGTNCFTQEALLHEDEE